MKQKRKKAAEAEPLVVPMSPEAAAIIHAHLPEPWVQRANFVGPAYERLRAEEADAPSDGAQDE